MTINGIDCKIRWGIPVRNDIILPPSTLDEQKRMITKSRVKTPKLECRVYVCPECGRVFDRDYVIGNNRWYYKEEYLNDFPRSQNERICKECLQLMEEN